MASPDCTNPAPGPSPIRRLTRFELNNTLHDLLRDTTKAANVLPAEVNGNGFNNQASLLTTTRQLVEAYNAIASTVAATATKDAAVLANFSTCDAAAQGEDACAHAFVSGFGQQAYRRPLSDVESAALFTAYTAGRADSGTYAQGLASVVQMALQTPQFLYRVEVGVQVPGKSIRRLTSSEMATRLSYSLWGSMPDTSLLAVAAANGLDTADQIKAQAQQMLQNPRAREMLHYFADTLYGIGGSDALVRDKTMFPTYNEALGPLFRQESETFIDDVVWNGAGDFATLWNAPYSFVNGPLAAFYGDMGVTGDAFQRVPRDPTRRLGLLTQASVLAATTTPRNNPVSRGKFIYEKLLCGSVQSPPSTLNVKLPPEDPTRTTRERFTAHRVMEPCKSCHTMLDPIGFGLENFNSVGLWQDIDNGKPIDASGEIPPGLDISGPFSNAVDLAKKIASSDAARSCFADKWISLAYGRSFVAGDAGEVCSKNQIESAFRAANGNVKALLVAATQTDDFLYLPAASSNP